MREPTGHRERTPDHFVNRLLHWLNFDFHLAKLNRIGGLSSTGERKQKNGETFAPPLREILSALVPKGHRKSASYEVAGKSSKNPGSPTVPVAVFGVAPKTRPPTDLSNAVPDATPETARETRALPKSFIPKAGSHETIHCPHRSNYRRTDGKMAARNDFRPPGNGIVPHRLISRLREAIFASTKRLAAGDRICFDGVTICFRLFRLSWAEWRFIKKPAPKLIRRGRMELNENVSLDGLSNGANRADRSNPIRLEPAWRVRERLCR